MTLKYQYTTGTNPCMSELRDTRASDIKCPVTGRHQDSITSIADAAVVTGGDTGHHGGIRVYTVRLVRWLLQPQFPARLFVYASETMKWFIPLGFIIGILATHISYAFLVNVSMSYTEIYCETWKIKYSRIKHHYMIYLLYTNWFPLLL